MEKEREDEKGEGKDRRGRDMLFGFPSMGQKYYLG